MPQPENEATQKFMEEYVKLCERHRITLVADGGMSWLEPLTFDNLHDQLNRSADEKWEDIRADLLRTGEQYAA